MYAIFELVHTTQLQRVCARSLAKVRNEHGISTAAAVLQVEVANALRPWHPGAKPDI